MTGWECPKCGACYAPTVAMCFNCTGQVVTVGGVWTTTTDELCPRCFQDRRLPSGMGCPADSHYGYTLVMKG